MRTSCAFRNNHGADSFCKHMKNNRLFLCVKWLSGIWLVIWIPTYSTYWGWSNFLHLCNVAVFLTCLGFLLESPLLLSSQALVSIFGNFLWVIEFLNTLVTGHALFGGTEYMMDEQIPIWVRCLSLYHFVLPLLLLWGLYCVGYDRGGWKLQSTITLLVLFLSRFTDSTKNINFVFHDPLFQKTWGNALMHVMVIWFGLILIIYWPTHLVLDRVFPRPKKF